MSEQQYPLDLGTHCLEVSTSSPKAQHLFNLGLRNCFAFCHEEAIVCFKQALQHDPNCVMAHWGVAFANGVNYNSGDFIIDPQEAYEHAQLAHQKCSTQDCPRVEQLLTAAIVERYVWPQAENPKDKHAEQRRLNAAFAAKMREAYTEMPTHCDVAALFVESLMNIRPWRLWDKSSDGTFDQATLEIQQLLESSLELHPDHPALLHLYIHCMELSPFPEKGLFAADKLRTLVPDSGHLLHMPAHIDMWLGHYKEAVDTNAKGIIADEKYVAITGQRLNFYQGYRMHNYHFLVWAALFDGQYTAALNNAREIQRQLPAEAIKIFPEYFEGLATTVFHVWIRFGKWEEVLAEPMPQDIDLWCCCEAVGRYARGIALASLGRVDEAEQELQLFLKAMKHPFLRTRYIHNNTMFDIMQVGIPFLKGELEYRKGNFTQAFDLLREAIKIDDALQYDEPWGWMHPPRHALGALLTEQGQLSEACEVFQADLKKYPNNIWALSGLRACLRKQGASASAEELGDVESRLKEAGVRCEVDLESSCFCAQVCGAAAPRASASHACACKHE